MKRRLAKLFAGAAVTALVLALGGAAGAAPVGPQGTPPLGPLVVTDARPDGGSTDFPVATSIFVHFNRALDFATLAGNVSIKKVGTRKPLPLMHVGYLPPGPINADAIAILNPANDLKPNTRYQVVVQGGKGGVLAEDGSRLGGVTGTTAKFRDKNVVWSFTTASATG